MYVERFTRLAVDIKGRNRGYQIRIVNFGAHFQTVEFFLTHPMSWFCREGSQYNNNYDLEDYQLVEISPWLKFAKSEYCPHRI